MAKVKRKWVTLDWNDAGCLRAQDIPYDETIDIKTKIDSIAAPSLNNAYTYGKTINITDGPVKIDPTSSDYAALELTPVTFFPTSGLTTGQLVAKNGSLYYYDGAKSKWLSVSRLPLIFGKKGLSKNQYLETVSGLVSSSSSYRLVRNSCVVSMSIQLEEQGTCTVSLRKNDEITDLYSLTITNDRGISSILPNLNLSIDDFLQCFISNTSSVDSPLVLLELAWR